MLTEEVEASIPGPIGGDAAWRGEELAGWPGRWTYRLTENDIAEIDRAVAAIRASGISLDRISPTTFPLPGLRARLGAVLDHELLSGLGFHLMRGLPVDRYGIEEAAIAFLGVGSHFGSFRSA